MLTPETEQTLAELYESDAAQRAAGLPSSQRTRNLDRQSGRFLRLLAIGMRAEAVLEIGSSNGVSTIWLASAMGETGGMVTGTELLAERAAQANANLARAGLADFGRVIAGEARETVRGLVGPFDLVFIDAEKDDYVEHARAVLPLVRRGGLIVADNVISHDLAIYQAFLRAQPGLEHVTLPLERGLEIAAKLE
jgi:predicted O-methyltransferase YrrM